MSDQTNDQTPAPEDRITRILRMATDAPSGSDARYLLIILANSATAVRTKTDQPFYDTAELRALYEDAMLDVTNRDPDWLRRFRDVIKIIEGWNDIAIRTATAEQASGMVAKAPTPENLSTRILSMALAEPEGSWARAQLSSLAGSCAGGDPQSDRPYYDVTELRALYDEVKWDLIDQDPHALVALRSTINLFEMANRFVLRLPNGDIAAPENKDPETT
ncbi:hypothetical protein [Chachezhania sediminis]|uniref:hypothetical protein n=1 Tax=Chachezhania sediminis TaxID=2599291 RepID=UPI00131E4EF8|nr:hypothetical protein [Chachezhania sediminis]